MVAAGQQGLAGRGTQGRGVEPVVLEAPGRKTFGIWRCARAAEGAGRAETHVVQQHDQHIRGALGREQRLDGGISGFRIFGVIGRQTRRGTIGDRQHRTRVSVR